MNLSRYYMTKAVLNDIRKFGKNKFLELFQESKVAIPKKNCTELKDEEIEKLIQNLIATNLNEETGIWGNKTATMQKIVASIGELMCYSEAAFDHTAINFGGSTRSFTRAPRGVSDVFKAQSTNPKLSITYVLCASKKHGVLPGYYIIPENVASKNVLKDLQIKGEIPTRIQWETNEAGWANKYSGVRITRMITG